MHIDLQLFLCIDAVVLMFRWTFTVNFYENHVAGFLDDRLNCWKKGFIKQMQTPEFKSV